MIEWYWIPVAFILGSQIGAILMAAMNYVRNKDMP